MVLTQNGPEITWSIGWAEIARDHKLSLLSRCSEPRFPRGNETSVSFSLSLSLSLSPSLVEAFSPPLSRGDSGRFRSIGAAVGETSDNILPVDLIVGCHLRRTARGLISSTNASRSHSNDSRASILSFVFFFYLSSPIRDPSFFVVPHRSYLLDGSFERTTRESWLDLVSTYRNVRAVERACLIVV